jgi:hypothetical protein
MKKMKNFKQITVGLMIGAMAIGFSAFTSAERFNSSFYVYTSSSTAQADIQNINNYVSATNACVSGSNVCGVTLTTAKPAGQTPVLSEFNGESTNLWGSQDSGLPKDSHISMKN